MNKRYINVKDIQRGVADTYLGVNGNGAVLSPNNSDEIDSAIAALNNQIDSIHETLNSDYYVNIAPNYTFESNTTVSREITGAYYNEIKAAVADNKMVMAAIVDGAVKTFNLIEQGKYNLRFASYTTDANGVQTDYIVLTEVQDGFPPNNVTVGYNLSYQSEYSTYPTADLRGYATEQWVEGKGYLTSVPSEYVTETELNDAISNLDVGGIPYVVFGTPSTGNVPTVLAGSVEDALYASIRKEPHFVYVYNGSINDYGASGELTQLTVSSGFIGRQFEAYKYDALKNEVVEILLLISPDVANGGYSCTISSHRFKTATHSWVEAYYQKKGNYLTSVPSEYVTDDELNDAIANLEVGGIPTVVISTGDANSTTPIVTGGDLDAVINAISENAPYIAYFVNVGTRYGVFGKKYLIQAADFNSLYNTGALYYHTEIDGGNHMDVQIFFRKENDVYTVFNITRQFHYYQEQLTSGANIKTINGNSILGSGDLTIEGGGTTDLTGYATEQWVEDKGYLTGVPSEYVTETELNDAISNLEVGGIQSVVAVDSFPYLSVTTTDNDVELSLQIGDMLSSNAGLIDAQSTLEYLTEKYYNKDSIDDMVGDINTILENIIG